MNHTSCCYRIKLTINSTLLLPSDTSCCYCIILTVNIQTVRLKQLTSHSP